MQSYTHAETGSKTELPFGNDVKIGEPGRERVAESLRSAQSGTSYIVII